jgi:guanine nucleotide-binding protein G(I)/G(S)/G(T) subunit beta-1
MSAVKSWELSVLSPLHQHHAPRPSQPSSTRNPLYQPRLLQPSAPPQPSAFLSGLRARYSSLLTTLSGLQRAKEELIDWRANGYKDLHAFDFRVRRTLRGAGRVTALGWGGDGYSLATATADGRVVLWNANMEQMRGMVHLPHEWPMAVAIEPSRSEVLAVGGLSHSASIFSTADLQATGSGGAGSGRQCSARAVLGGASSSAEEGSHTSYISALRFPSPDRVATASGDGSLGVWDLTLVQRLQTLPPAPGAGPASCLACHPLDPEMLLAGSADGWVRVWDLRAPPGSGAALALGGFYGAVTACDFFPSGMALAGAGEDSTVRLFDLRSGGAVGVYTEDALSFPATGCAFSRSGALIFATYAAEGLCVAWEPLSADGLLHELKGHEGAVSCCAVNGEGQALATGGHDSKVNIWA